jgi:hypothetical protein
MIPGRTGIHRTDQETSILPSRTSRARTGMETAVAGGPAVEVKEVQEVFNHSRSLKVPLSHHRSSNRPSPVLLQAMQCPLHHLTSRKSELPQPSTRRLQLLGHPKALLL